ncbi:MAG: hypothetical protein H0X24_06260 [Ktedonobacterales bacterium]|nr:hypothetical protein [Ktedonobacterales bacterium]
MLPEDGQDVSFSEALHELSVEKGQLKAMRDLAHEAAVMRFRDVAAETLARIDALTDTELLRRLILEKEQIADSAELGTILDEAEGAQPGE